MSFFLIPSTGQVVAGDFATARATANGAFFIGCDENGNTCHFPGRNGHSSGFCTASACY